VKLLEYSMILITSKRVSFNKCYYNSFQSH